MLILIQSFRSDDSYKIALKSKLNKNAKIFSIYLRGNSKDVRKNLN